MGAVADINIIIQDKTLFKMSATLLQVMNPFCVRLCQHRHILFCNVICHPYAYI